MSDIDTCRSGDRLGDREFWDAQERLMPGDPASCPAELGLACCTRPRDHAGQHVATCYGGIVAATWVAQLATGPG